MYNWMMMTGLAGMMAWVMPGCGAMAFAQCGTRCGPADGQVSHGRAAGTAATAEGTGRSPGMIDAERSTLPRCPVMGDAVNFGIRTMTDDGPVYFCCAMCPAKFEKDPAKYADKLTTQREALAARERVQANCPVDGKAVDGKVASEVGGQKIAFCSKACRTKYMEHPAAFKAGLAGRFTYQTHCPVTDEPIAPGAFADLGAGQRIYLCCPNCSSKLLNDPAKYAPQLAEQGVTIDAKGVAAQDAKPKQDEHAGHTHP